MQDRGRAFRVRLRYRAVYTCFPQIGGTFPERERVHQVSRQTAFWTRTLSWNMLSSPSTSHRYGELFGDIIEMNQVSAVTSFPVAFRRRLGDNMVRTLLCGFRALLYLPRN